MANSLNKITTKSILDATVATADIAADAITAAKIADDVINSEHIAAGAVDLEHMSSESVDEDNLKISNAGSDGQFLSKQSGNTGGLTWATVSTTDSSKMPLAGGTFTGDVTFDGETAGRDIVWDRSDNRLEFADSAEITFGSGADSSIVHDGSNFTLTCATGDIRIRPKVGEEGITLEADGATKLYYDNAERIATSASGVEISKAGDSCELTIKGGEGEPAVLRLQADEGDDAPDNWRVIGETSGNLNIQNYASGGWETNITALGNGAVELRYDNALAFQTATNGAIFYGTEGAACEVKMYADEGDDAADKWLLQATAAGAFNIYNNDGSWQERLTMSSTGGSLKGRWYGVAHCGGVLDMNSGAHLDNGFNTGSVTDIETGVIEIAYSNNLKTNSAIVGFANCIPTSTANQQFGFAEVQGVSTSAFRLSAREVDNDAASMGVADIDNLMFCVWDVD